MNSIQVDGSDFEASYDVMKYVCDFVRKERKPYLVHAQVPLLGHHTSGVRKEFYRTMKIGQNILNMILVQNSEQNY